MKQILFAAALGATITATAAQAQYESQVILMGDTSMSCRDVVLAANQQSEILGGVPEAGLFGSEAAINSMTGLAMQGALRSGAADAIPGIGAVGGLLGRAARARAEQEEARRQVAERRWYYLNGLYQGRDCDNVLRREAEQAAAAAAAETAPVETAGE
ncbi:hypothetical protein AAFF88_14610 [Hyphobacterium sp. WM6]|uniref:hypothetical protein n=1 Tax=Hyphobacterium sp. WM6 TaxID=3140243 RepID=UPI0031B69065